MHYDVGVAALLEDAGEASGGLGDGGLVASLEAHPSDWLESLAADSGGTQGGSTQGGDESPGSESDGGAGGEAGAGRAGHPGGDGFVAGGSGEAPRRYCVEELALSWPSGGGGIGAWGVAEPRALDDFTAALLPLLPRPLAGLRVAGPVGPSKGGEGGAAASRAATSPGNAAAAAAAAAADPPVANLWAHSAGSVTPAHYDTAHNVLLQLVGRKRVR